MRCHQSTYVLAERLGAPPLQTPVDSPPDLGIPVKFRRRRRVVRLPRGPQITGAAYAARPAGIPYISALPNGPAAWISKSAPGPPTILSRSAPSNPLFSRIPQWADLQRLFPLLLRKFAWGISRRCVTFFGSTEMKSARLRLTRLVLGTLPSRPGRNLRTVSPDLEWPVAPYVATGSLW